MPKYANLEKLQQQRQKLQNKEKQLQEGMLIEIGNVLMRSGALSIDYFTLIGGILSVVEKANKKDNIVEEWQQQGRKFCRVRLKNKRDHKTESATATSQDNAQ